MLTIVLALNLKLSANNLSAPQTPQTNSEKHFQSYRRVRRIGNDWPKTVWQIKNSDLIKITSTAELTEILVEVVEDEVIKIFDFK